MTQDKNGNHEIHYKEFREVVGYGKTEQEAESYSSFDNDAKRKGEKIREQSLNKYYKH